MRTIIVAIALGLTACAPPASSGYQGANITLANEEDCREQASAAATRAYEIFGYRGNEDLAMNAYKSTYDRCSAER
jgi:hypothetical protein